jgi:hypothetical protein
MRLYSRIDSLGRHILQVHLNQASRHNYGFQGLLQPLSDALSLTDWSPAQFPPVVSWLRRVQMHYMDQSSKVRKEPVWFVLVFLSVISAPRWDLNYRRFKKVVNLAPHSSRNPIHFCAHGAHGSYSTETRFGAQSST